MEKQEFTTDNLSILVKLCTDLRVLYVEDNEEAKAQTVKLLDNFFSHIDTAENGVEGFELFSSGNYDIIISDINMPLMNGIELLKKIRSINQDIPVLLFTAHADKDFFLDSIKYDVDGYLAKPITLEAIVLQLNKTVKNLVIKKEHDEYKRSLENLNDELEHKVQLRTEQISMRLNADDLTNKLSRHALINRLSNVSAINTPVVILIDIQGFKLFNELYGLEIGNEILIRLANLLESYTSTTNYTLYRVSGDEFALFEEVRHVDENTHTDFAFKLCSFIRSYTFHLESIDENVMLDVTVGISFSRDNPLGKADMALNRSKELNTSVTTYNSMHEIEKKTKDTLYWKKEITDALNEDRIVPYLHPIYNKNGDPVKYELLTRLIQIKDGEETIVSPVQFFDIAAKTGRYNLISFRVIKTALNMLKNCKVSLTININYSDLNNPDVINILHESLTDYFNTPEKTITLEVLENDSIADYRQFAQMLKVLRSASAKIAIDDFGSGYSNFSHIAGLNPDFLKIDGSLIRNIAESEKAYKIAKSLVGFAKELGMKTIAEYVYNKEVFEAAVSIGADEFQGYYFSEPVPLKTILKNLD